MQVASRISRIQPSATLTINAKAQELKAQGREVVSLAVGQPDFAPPEHVCQAAAAAASAGDARYTPVPGSPEARDAVAGSYETLWGVQAARDEVILANGGKHALYNLFQALLDADDEVLLPAPYWVSYPDMVAMADGHTVVVPTSARDRFLVSVEALEAARTDKTRVLIMNTPSNPTGVQYAQAELDAIARWAMDRGIFVISDEVYDRLVYPPAEPATLAHWWKKHPEHFALVGACSKTYAMPGWRFGWTLAHPDLVKAMSKIQSQSTSNICNLAQAAGIAALTGPQDKVHEMAAAFMARREVVMEGISAWPKVICPKPDGAFYVFPDVCEALQGRYPSAVAFCEAALDEAGVAMVPGEAFGSPGCVRLSYAVHEDVLRKAIAAVGKMLGA